MTTKNKNPKHNKLRLVYALDNDGNVASYIHVEHSEADRIIAILKFLNQNPGWLPVHKIEKGIKQKYPTLVNTLSRMAGAIRADMKKDGQYTTLVKGQLIHVKKAMMNKRRNLNKRLNYLTAPIYVRRAHT